MSDKLERLLEELRNVFRRDAGDAGVGRIHQCVKRELPGVRQRLYQEERLGRILRHFRERDFGIVSAFRKGLPEEENLERQFRLSRDVRAKGLGYIPIVGRWEGVPERSLFVPDMVREEALELGRRYEQDAVIWGSKGEAELLDPRTGEVVLAFRRLRVLDVDRAFDDYSAMRLVKGRPVRPFRLEPSERDEVVRLELEDLRPGDVVYAEPSDRLTGMRFLIWPSLCLFRFAGMEEGKARLIPLGDEPEPVDEGGRVGKLLRSEASLVRTFPVRWIGRLIRAAGPSAGVS